MKRIMLVSERNAASPSERLLDDCLRVLANPAQSMDDRQEVKMPTQRNTF